MNKKKDVRGILRKRCLRMMLQAALLVMLTGCGRVVFITGLDMDELFTVGEQRGSCRELRVYLLTMENQYKSAYGEDVFTREGNETVGDSLKENALERLVKVKVLNQMAENEGVRLEETEIAQATQAAQQYMESLSEADRQYLRITQTTVQTMFQEYLLAAKEASGLTADVSREVSDDEARSVTVQNILIKTYTTDASGNRQEFSAEQKAEAKARAEAILQEIRDGMDNNLGITFLEYIAKYNEGDSGTVVVSKGSVDSAFEEAAFNQQVNSISDVIETTDGYRIIKPVATSDETQLLSNKENILAKRLQEAYETAYDSGAAAMDYQLRQQRWNQVELCENEEAASDSFFACCTEIAGEYLEQ
jgi:foldase protein PrsA